MATAEKEELRLGLLQNARAKTGRGLRVERYDDDAANQASKERCNPLRTVHRPDKDAVSFRDASGLQLASELKSTRSDTLSRPATRSQTRLVRECGLRATRAEIINKTEDGSAYIIA
jgi:hypothetical protein